MLLEEIPSCSRTPGRASSNQDPAAPLPRRAMRARGERCPRVETVMAEDPVVTTDQMEDLPMEMTLTIREVAGVRTGRGTFEGSRGTRLLKRSRGSLRCR